MVAVDRSVFYIRTTQLPSGHTNALAESVIGLFKTELINPGTPWRTAEQVEAATLHYVHWFNHHRLLETNGDLPPLELEQAYYRLHHSDFAEAG
jgi:putative transposase